MANENRLAAAVSKIGDLLVAENQPIIIQLMLNDIADECGDIVLFEAFKQQLSYLIHNLVAEGVAANYIYSEVATSAI